MKEECRQSPEAWRPVGMIPHYSKALDQRYNTGGESSSMRHCEIIQACYCLLLSEFNEKTKEALQMEWADGLLYSTRASLACLLADQPECDKLCCNHGNCHHCWVEKKDFLNLEMDLSLKTSDDVRLKVLEAAEGVIAVDSISNRRLVLARSRVAYEKAKASCGGFHLMNNVFWQLHDFDLHQQIMRCSMHGIELGIVRTVFAGCIQTLHKVFN